MELSSSEATPSSHHGESSGRQRSNSTKTGWRKRDIWKVIKTMLKEMKWAKEAEEDAKEDIQAVHILLFIMTAAVASIGVYVFGFREHGQQQGALGDLNALQAGRHLFQGLPETERDARVMPRKMVEPCKPPKAICDPMPVLCTIGSDPFYGKYIALPPLGYCSIVFYDSISHISIEANGSTRSRRLNEFLRLAMQNSGWSEFGVAFDYWFAEAASAMLSEPNGTRMLAPFEENGVAHYGMLTDWSGWSYNAMHHRTTLDLFRVLRQYQRQRDAGRPFLLGGIVYAVKMLPSYNREQLDIFDHIVKDFKVDMLVATTHMEQTYQYTLDCKITGPTTWDKKYDPHELPIADVIKQLSDRRYLDLDIPVALSFTLKGFWYKPEKNEDDSDFAPGKPCGYIVGGETFGSYTEVCENTTYRKQMTSIEEGHFFNYTFYREYDRTFVFDTLSSITQKVVLAHRAHRGLSFALFDIDYEDVFDQCPGNLYGAFDRVAAVRWLTDRFKEIQEAAVIGGPESTAS